MDYLIKRKNVLDGLVISGGEPTLQKGIEEFVSNVKEKTELLIKIDTNGTNPNKLRNLIDKKLVDYIAMDIKDDIEGYKKITRINNIDTNKIKESIKIIKENLKQYEFRTTIIKNYHDINKIKNIINLIDDESHYYMQKFILSDNVPNKNLLCYDNSEFEKMYEEIKKEYPNIKIRGI